MVPQSNVANKKGYVGIKKDRDGFHGVQRITDIRDT